MGQAMQRRAIQRWRAIPLNAGDGNGRLRSMVNHERTCEGSSKGGDFNGNWYLIGTAVLCLSA